MKTYSIVLPNKLGQDLGFVLHLKYDHHPDVALCDRSFIKAEV